MSQMTGQTSIQTRIRQITALAGFVGGVLAGLPYEQIQYWLKNKTLLREKLQGVFKIAVQHDLSHTGWESFYSKYFGITVDLSEVKIPNTSVEGVWHAIFVPQGLTLNATIVAMRKVLKVWVHYKDLDGNVLTNTRTSMCSYAVLVRINNKPDAEYLGKSTRDADMEGKIGITLLERLLLGFKYFTDTGKHLDTKHMTLCTGSRDAEGDIPGVSWYTNSADVTVNFYTVDEMDEKHGLRRVIS